jgi:hypothetical protein
VATFGKKTPQKSFFGDFFSLKEGICERIFFFAAYFSPKDKFTGTCVLVG